MPTKKKAAKRPATKKAASPTVEQQIRAVARVCRGPFAAGYDPIQTRERINRMRAQGKRAEAQALEIASRQGCGADFNDVILAHPLDGKDRTVKCPQCKLAISYRAPLFG